MKRIGLILVIIIVAILLGVPVQARSLPYDMTDSNQCVALDIVFLIDQSYSMSRPEKPNDPLQMRVYAAQYAIDWLGTDRLARYTLCSGSVHRIGVVSFGTETRAQLKLDEGVINPQSSQEWTYLRSEMIQKIEPLNLDATLPKKAFEEASKMFKNAPVIGNIPRKRAIVFLTDGQPCGVGEYCGRDFQIRYMREFQDQINKDFDFSPALHARDIAINSVVLRYGGLSRVPKEVIDNIYKQYPVTNEELLNSTYIFSILLNSGTPYLPEVKVILEDISKNYGGEVFYLTENRNEIPQIIIDKIMAKLLNVGGRIVSCGNLPVNPYLSGLVLDIYKVADGLEVKIEAEGKYLERGEGDKEYFGLSQYGVYGAIEHYRFIGPPAGLWKIQCSDPNGAKVYYQHFNAQVKMLNPNVPLPYYDIGGRNFDPKHPEYLQYQIMDISDGTPLNEDPDYPLNIWAVITTPSGNNITINEFDFIGEGIWKSRQPLPVNEIGDYKVSLKATAECVQDPENIGICESPQFTVVEDNNGQYSVLDVPKFDVKILEPKPGDSIPLHGPLFPDWLPKLPIDVTVQLVDENGKPLTVRSVYEDPSVALTASLKAGNEKREIPLKPLQDDPTLLSASFSMPAVLGEQEVEIKVLDTYRYQEFRPKKNLYTVQIYREDPLLRRWFFWKLIAGILVIILTLLLIYIIYIRTFPLNGRLKFVKNQSGPELGLGKGRRMLRWNRKNLPGDLSRDFGQIRVENQPSLGGKARVRLTAGKNTLTLIEGQPVTLSGWQIKYESGAHSKPKDHFRWLAFSTVMLAIVIIVWIFLSNPS